ncbi:LOB domain-containing protein 6, partial [Phtheirospermum japonicum]
CVFALYFRPDNPHKFINVQEFFSASNIGKILNELNPTPRNDAVKSLAYEAECRIKDPIYGCVVFVSLLQHHLRQVQQEIEWAKKELATYIRPAAAEF